MSELEFNLSSRTKTVVENFARINPAMIFRRGSVLRTTSPNEDLVGFANITENIPEKFAIHDLSKFLGILGLYESPKILIGEKTLTINGNGRKFVYTLAAEKLIFSPSEAAYDKLKAVLTTNEITKVELPVDELKMLKKYVSIADLPEVALFSDGQGVYLKGLKSDNPTGDQYTTQLAEKEVPSFNILFTQQKINSLLDEKYTVTIAKDIVSYKGSDVEYFIAPEGSSTY